LVLLTCVALLTAGIGIKSAMFPFHRWLPDAHGSATTTASAVLSGLVLKGYAVLLILFYVRVFTLETVLAFKIETLVFILGFIGMIVGSVRAIREDHIKRMLAYSSVAQLGYVFMGIGLGTAAGVAAACFQIISHAFTKPLLFMSAGRLSAIRGHSKKFQMLRGSAWESPMAGVAYAIGALSMIGIPLLGGFAAKYYLGLAAVGDPGKMLAAMLVLAGSSVLNAMYYLPAIVGIWFPADETKAEPMAVEQGDMGFIISTVVFIVLNVVLGVAIEPVIGLIELGLKLL
jgi:multicomponent Na+:H+ antiporter subunit D